MVFGTDIGGLVTGQRLSAERLDLCPLHPSAAAALPGDRELAAGVIGARLPSDWPAVDLLDVLPMQAAASPETVHFGVWVMIERATNTVVSDIGFFGPPDSDRTVEIGYSVVADRRRRGYATEAARTLIEWALDQPGVTVVVAGCDPTNVPSIRTLARLGFSHQEPDGDQLRWACSR